MSRRWVSLIAAMAPLYLFCQMRATRLIAAPGIAQIPAPGAGVKLNPLRDAYYGDLHLHTSYSFDAYLYGTTKVGPDEAYRFAKGDVVYYLGQPVQRREPLDFLAVTDHSESIGVLADLENPDSAVSRSELGKRLRALLAEVTTPDGHRDMALDPTKPGEPDPFDGLWRDFFEGRHSALPAELKAAPQDAWAREIAFANRNYEPGRFTTFIAYEWTSQANLANLHRNVIFRGDSAPNPFTTFDSKDPKDLWDWLEAIRKQGIEALAIPHNGNASNGLMYDWVTASETMGRSDAEERQANEPLSEISQGKGASETHPLLSPSDEFADFEIYDFLESYRLQAGRPQGSYLRDALSAGLVLQRRLGVNPFKYGFVGGSDLHTGLSVSAQADYAGSHWQANLGGGKPTERQVADGFAGTDADGTYELNLKTTSGNLTGVWAESNTRESLYSALRRRETFATSGSRLRFRFFGGWAFPEDLLRQKRWVATAYAGGVPMGGDLPPQSGHAGAPRFAIWAAKDPNGANLDRVQIIKVWEQAGRQKQRIFDVVWSGHRHADPVTGIVASVGTTVDLSRGTYANTIGATELAVLWQDPSFDPTRAAAYYLRVLEIPTPRWSTLLAVHYGLPLPQGVPAAEQQRGWSSPIWYTPAMQ